jgi:multidrug efflux pump subunit AcrB
LKINPQDIENAILQTNFIESNGYTIDYRRLYLTVTDASVKSKEEIENIVISNNEFRNIKIKDVANVEISERSEYIKIKADGKNVPLIAVLKQPESNLIEVASEVSFKVSEINKILPTGVTLEPYYNQAEFVGKSIKSIIDVLWIGLLLAIVVTIIFLRSFKASFVILITIPLTLALTFITLYAINFDFNIMTIGAIAASIGLIIDDAIIVVEQIHRTHEDFFDKKPTELVGKAIKFLFPSMVSSSLSTIVILIPFALMTGVAGAYFKVLTETMIITLVSSFIVTWLGLPVIYLLFSNNKTMTEKGVVHVVKERKWVDFFTKRTYISLALVSILILAIVLIIPKLETGFLPVMDEGSIVLDYNSPPGTSLEETDIMLSEVDKILETIPEVDTYSRRTGTQMGFFITEPNRGDYLIELKKKRKLSTDEVSDIIRKKVEESVPALTVDFGQVITDMLGDLISSAQPVEIKIFGDDHEKLKEISKEIASKIEKIEGTADVFDGIIVAGPIINIIPNEKKLKQFGLTPSNLQTQVQYYLEGTVVGNVPEKEQLTEIRLISPVNNKTSVEQLKELKICTSSGNFMNLKELASFSIQSGISEIERENLKTMGIVTAGLNNRDLGSVMKEIQKSLKDINLPPSYQIVYGGSYAEQQKSFSELLTILLSGGLLVFTIILFMFKNLKISILVLLISVLGISGSIIALYFTKTPLNVGSYTGLIMIIGIIGENSIFTIQQFLFELKNSNVQSAITHAISSRLRPKLMTATGAIVALLPLSLGIGTGAQMHQPLAIAVIGGLIIAVPLLLIVLPSFLVRIIKNVD